MSFVDRLFGKPLATSEEGEQRVGPFAGIPMLGLDALGSAAYGPEAALTLLIPLGALSVAYIGPISAIKCAGAFGQHRLCRFPTPVPGDRARRLFATRVCHTRSPFGVFAGHLCVDRVRRNSADRVRRHYRPTHSAVCSRRVSRVYTLTGWHGCSLAQAGRAERWSFDAVEWRRCAGNRPHAARSYWSQSLAKEPGSRWS